MADDRLDGLGGIVVKVGGSLAETGRLKEVLAILAGATRRVTVVAGGGQFADKVRDLQTMMRFDDRIAHRLAILGMHQMAEVYFSLEPRFAPAETTEEFALAHAAGRIPVWLPLRMCETDETLPADWTITSDGLAARLAERLGRLPLVLLKSITVDATLSAAALADDDIVDPVFPEIVARARLDWRILGPEDGDALAAILDSPPGGLKC